MVWKREEDRYPTDVSLLGQRAFRVPAWSPPLEPHRCR